MTQTQPQAKPNAATATAAFALSWLLFAVAVLVCLLGLFVAGKRLLDKPTAQLVVVGGELTELEKDKLQEVLRPQLKGNYFTADLPTLLSHAQSLDWLERVELHRRWPNTIEVQAKPYFAVARFGSSRYLSADGSVFARPLHIPDNSAALPTLYGDSSKTADMMLSFNQVKLWFEPLGLQLSEVVVTDQNTWFFKFKQGFRVIVDRQNAQQKLYHLSYLAAHQLKPYLAQIESADLRYRNGMAVLWKQGEAPKNFTGQQLAAGGA